MSLIDRRNALRNPSPKPKRKARPKRRRTVAQNLYAAIEKMGVSMCGDWLSLGWLLYGASPDDARENAPALAKRLFANATRTANNVDKAKTCRKMANMQQAAAKFVRLAEADMKDPVAWCEQLILASCDTK